MSLRLLLDENISHIVANQIKAHRPIIPVESVHAWKEGAFKGRTDRALLRSASDDGLTLVTYDLKTIPPLLSELIGKRVDHTGIVFIDERTISNNDFGMLIRAIILFWERYHTEEWLNRIAFLERPTQNA